MIEHLTRNTSSAKAKVRGSLRGQGIHSLSAECPLKSGVKSGGSLGRLYSDPSVISQNLRRSSQLTSSQHTMKYG